MNHETPTVLVIFGITGDLMAKKIAPALYHLFKKKRLPKKFRVIGFSRKDFSDEGIREHIRKNLKKHAKIGKNDPFLELFSYHRGFYQSIKYYKSFAKILAKVDKEWGVCSNKLFYLVVPPHLYAPIFKNLAATKLTKPCSDEEGWTRIIVEKPFGKNLRTAQRLDGLLGKLFKEEQVYRIDHYLAKEMIQNILTFRFANNLFEQSLSNKFVESIEIRLLERMGVEGRGSFYDGVGALRDVGQNHLLQMLALVTMDKPADFKAATIRQSRAKLLETLKIPSQEEIKNFSYRAQYNGYRKIEGVAPKSSTETYFKVRAFLDNPRWQGIPIILESGKRIGKQLKEIVINFKKAPGVEHKNRLIFSLEPEEGITIQFLSKKPGLKAEVEERSLNFLYRKKGKSTQYVEEYEKLLLDCIEGEQTLFVSTEEVQAMWRYTDPIINSWQKNIVPLKTYKPGTTKVLKDARFIEPKLKKIGIIGLGKMGANIARQLVEKNWTVVGFNRTAAKTKNLEKEGLVGTYSLKELAKKLPKPRVIWIMLTAGKAFDNFVFDKDGLVNFLDKGDIIIDGGNSFYKDSIERAEKLAKKGINFVDVGVSGGPGGARHGACLMVGGNREIYEYLLPLFIDISISQGVQSFEGAGAGHFVKMIHNGIEYGMMQAIAEGFNIMKKAKYRLNLKDVAEIYNHGSVIESRLVGWLKGAFELHSENLKGVSGTVAHTGEGAWTVDTAKELRLKAKIIEEALNFRIQSEKNPSYTGKILSALREQFGGHSVKPL